LSIKEASGYYQLVLNVLCVTICDVINYSASSCAKENYVYMIKL